MTTARLCRARTGYPSEEQEQARLAALLDVLVPRQWTHPANERKCHPAAGARLKRAGVKRGVPDVLIFKAPPAVSGKVGMAIELKSKSPGARVSEDQRMWLDNLERNGWVVAVCYGFDEALSALRNCGYTRAA